eukprot:SAG31_NODE_1580_length_7835_cov_4.074457_3_plen_188_part_00
MSVTHVVLDVKFSRWLNPLYIYIIYYIYKIIEDACTCTCVTTISLICSRRRRASGKNRKLFACSQAEATTTRAKEKSCCDHDGNGKFLHHFFGGKRGRGVGLLVPRAGGLQGGPPARKLISRATRNKGHPRRRKPPCTCCELCVPTSIPYICINVLEFFGKGLIFKNIDTTTCVPELSKFIKIAGPP